MRVSFKSFTEVGFGTSKFRREIHLMGGNCVDEEINDAEPVIKTDGKDKRFVANKIIGVLFTHTYAVENFRFTTHSNVCAC